jgi:hypothetical protein
MIVVSSQETDFESLEHSWMIGNDEDDLAPKFYDMDIESESTQ